MNRLCFYLFLFACVLSAEVEYREVTNRSGLKIRARVIQVVDGLVELERDDRRVFRIPLSELSAEDVERIEAEMAEAAEAAIVKYDLEAARERLAAKYLVDSKMSKSEAREAFNQGMNHLKAKNFEKALEAWLSIPEKRDAYADARRRAGFNVLGRELGDWEGALVCLLDAYAESARDERVLEDLGRAYMRLDDYDNAEIYLSKARTRNAKAALKELEAMRASDG